VAWCNDPDELQGADMIAGCVEEQLSRGGGTMDEQHDSNIEGDPVERQVGTPGIGGFDLNGGTTSGWDAGTVAGSGDGGSRKSSRWRRVTVMGVVGVVVLVAAGVTLGIVFSGGQDAQAAVINAVKSAESAHSAAVTGSLSVSGSGVAKAGASGSFQGVADLGDGALRLNTKVSAAGRSFAATEIYLGGRVYEQIPGLSEFLPGKSWVTLDVKSATGTAIPDIGNPSDDLRMLEHKGNIVTAAGSGTVDGVPVQRYHVVLTKAGISNSLQSAPSWARTALEQVKIGSATEDVDIDSAGRLRSETFTSTEAVGRGSNAETVNITVRMDFSNFGVPVSISAPPAGQQIDFPQLLKGAAAFEKG
jgi:hypothetical protein